MRGAVAARPRGRRHSGGAGRSGGSCPISSINSALRNNQALVAENIEAALAAGDSDLANSFVELARDKGIAVSDELSKRVSDAVTDAEFDVAFCQALCHRVW